MDASEREQYRAAIHGDREAFEMIIRTHSRTLFAIGYGILQNREEAEDVVQDALVKAWKTRWRVREPEKFPAWLAAIARHRAHDVLRRRRTVPFAHETVEISGLELHDWHVRRDDFEHCCGECENRVNGFFRVIRIDGPAFVPGEIGREQVRQQLHSALAALPELHRAALTLRYFEEMDYRSIENTLGLTNGALRGILGRALASMRKQLRPALVSMD